MNPPDASQPNRDPKALSERFAQLRSAGRDDAALCVAHVARFLLEEQTPTTLRDFHRQYQPQRPRPVTRPLDNASWLQWLQHPDEDPYVGKLYESVLAFVRKSRALPLAKFGLAPSAAVNPSTSSAAIVRTLAAAARALAAPLPLIFMRTDQEGGLGHVPSEPIATVGGSGLASGRGLNELAFVAGQHMAMYRPDRYVHVLYPSAAELSTLIEAILKIGDVSRHVTPMEETVSQELRARMKKDPAALEHVNNVVRLFHKQEREPDIATWIVGAQRTALRAGLLLSGDLFVSRALLPMLPDVPFDALDDLVDFAVSDEYFALRQYTGIALWPAAGGAEPTNPNALKSVDIALDDLEASASEGALRSMEISLDDLGAGRDDALRSVEISLDDIDPTRAGAKRGADIRLDDVPTQTDPGAAASSLHTVEIRIEADGSPIDDSGDILAPAPSTASLRGDPPTVVSTAGPGELSAWMERFDIAQREGNGARALAIASVVVHRYRERAPMQLVAIVSDYRARETFAEGVRITREQWDVVRDPGERGAAGQFMEALDAVLAIANPRTPEDYGFERTEEAAATIPLSAALRWAARSIGASVPLVFVAEEQPRLLGRPAADPPVAVINPVLATTFTLAEVALVALEHVAYERPERRARVRIGDAATLIRCAVAAHAFCTRGERGEGTDMLVRRVIDVLASDALRYGAVARAAVQIKPFDVEDELTAWCLATERTAARAAIAAVFDLDAAARAFSADRGNPSRVPVEQKMAQLEEWVLSPEFARVGSFGVVQQPRHSWAPR